MGAVVARTIQPRGAVRTGEYTLHEPIIEGLGGQRAYDTGKVKVHAFSG